MGIQYNGDTGEFDRFTTTNERLETVRAQISATKIRIRTLEIVVICILVVLTALVLTGCSSSSSSTPVDLKGHWSQTKNDIADTELSATVTDGKIVVDLKIGEMTGPYWNGTYVEGLAADPTSFESHIDRNAIKYEKMGETKKFLYSDGAISFEFGAMGKSTIVYLKKD